MEEIVDVNQNRLRSPALKRAANTICRVRPEKTSNTSNMSRTYHSAGAT